MTHQGPDLELIFRRARSLSGAVLFAFILTHLVNHALMLVSLDAAETGQEWFFALWRHGVGAAVLYGAFLTHIGVNLIGLYRRQNWRLPAWQFAQIALGLLIPVLLIDHVVGTRAANSAFGVSDTYARVIYTLWVAAPEAGLMQLTVLSVAWLHGCIGLHYWLRIGAFYRAARPWLLAVAVLVPTLAALGFVNGGRTVEAMLANPSGRADFLAGMTLPTPNQIELLRGRGDVADTIYTLLLVLVVAARGIRAVGRHRRGYARVTYLDVRSSAATRTVEVPVGLTILEASRSAGVPHASVCGGRGRCSTCRVRVDGAEDGLDPAQPDERRVLDRVGADAGVRLACQARLQGDVRVTLLLPPSATARDARRRPAYLSGREMQIAVMFADLREFTRLAESRLPYDVVFILNRYFAAMGHSIEEAGGRIDKFIGDGVMALFGIESGVAEGCRQAIMAARAMGNELERLNAALAADLKHPLRIGIGVHAGPAIVGEIGFGSAAALTAIGDTVNVASRLEALTKVYGCELVISAETVARTEGDLGAFPRHEIEVRGRSQPLVIHAVDRLVRLPVLPAAPRPLSRR